MSDLSLFLDVFGLVFLAELPDKTAVAALVLATRNKASPVFAGTAVALAVQSAIAVGAGRIFARLPAHRVHEGAGILFIVSAIAMWRKAGAGDESPEGGQEAETHVRASFLRTSTMSFGVVFLAEWGDATQLATASLAARFPAPRLIFCSATLALWAAAAVAIFVGNRAARFVDPAVIQRVAAFLFAFVGLALLFDLV